MNIEKIAQGENSAERFYGQTYIYIPASLADALGRFALTKIVLQHFSKERLREHNWRIVKGEYQRISFYMLDLPSVLRYEKTEQPDFAVPDSLSQKIQETYARKKKNN